MMKAKAVQATTIGLTTALAFAALPVDAAQINFSTGARNGLEAGDIDPSFTWNYSGSYEDPRFNTYITPEENLTWIMPDPTLSSNDTYGDDVPEGFPSFNGIGYVFYEFFLPEDAENVRVDFERMFVDDRVSLALNGNNVGTYQFSLEDDQPTDGLMYASDGGIIPMRILGTGLNAFPITDQSFFRLGETNVIRYWFNNTFSTDPTAPAVPLQGDPDKGWLNLKGGVSFDQPIVNDPPSTKVPEPSAIAGLIALGAVTLKGLRKQASPH